MAETAGSARQRALELSWPTLSASPLRGRTRPLDRPERTMMLGAIVVLRGPGQCSESRIPGRQTALSEQGSRSITGQYLIGYRKAAAKAANETRRLRCQLA